MLYTREGSTPSVHVITCRYRIGVTLITFIRTNNVLQNHKPLHAHRTALIIPITLIPLTPTPPKMLTFQVPFFKFKFRCYDLALLSPSHLHMYAVIKYINMQWQSPLTGSFSKPCHFLGRSWGCELVDFCEVLAKFRFLL